MSAPRKLQTARGTMALLTVLSLCLGIMLSDLKALRAGATKAAPANATKGKRDKLSPDLRKKLKESKGDEEIDVIIETNGVVLGDSPSTDLATTDGVVPGNDYETFNLRSAKVKSKKLEALAARGDVAHVSLDREVKQLGHVTLTAGADAAAAMGGATTLRRHRRRHRRARLGHRPEPPRLQRRRQRLAHRLQAGLHGRGAHRRPLRPRHARRVARRRQRGHLGRRLQGHRAQREDHQPARAQLAGPGHGLDAARGARMGAGEPQQRGLQHQGRQHEPRHGGHRLLRERPALPRRALSRGRRDRRRRRRRQRGQGQPRQQALRADSLARQRPVGHHGRRREHLRHRRAHGRRRRQLQLARPDPQLLDRLVRRQALRQLHQARPRRARQQAHRRAGARQQARRGEPRARRGRVRRPDQRADVPERHLDGGARRRRGRRAPQAGQPLADAEPRQGDPDVHGAAARRLQPVRAGRRPAQPRRRDAPRQTHPHRPRLRDGRSASRCCAPTARRPRPRRTSPATRSSGGRASSSTTPSPRGRASSRSTRRSTASACSSPT